MERAAELGMPALATTDHGNLFSWLDFYEAGQKVGIKSILGIEAYMARNNRFSRAPEEIAGRAKSEADQKGPYHITLLAQNDRGYKNLIKLSSLSYLEGFYQKPRIDLDLLAEYSEGVICGSGCLNGIINQALLLGDYDKALQAASNLKDIFGTDNLFIEVMNHGIEEELQVLPDLVKIAKELDLRVVATQDSHYVRKEDSFGHDLLLCVSTGATVDQEDRFSFEPDEFYLKSYEEMLERFEPEWLSSSLDIAESVELELEFGKQFFPEFELPEGRETNEYFEEKAWEGIRLRYGDNPSDEVVERTNYELRVIKEMGFPSYFLVVADLMRFAREAGIRSGPGRGSSAASIVSYAMQITHLDPLWFNLPFERFLVEGRNTPPDIDLDVQDDRRHEMIEYVRDKYGHDRVAHIGTFTQVGAKTAIRDATRVLGLPFSFGDKISKMIPDPVLGVTKSIKESLESSKSMSNLYERSEEAKLVIDGGQALEGVYRAHGIHAAGVIISQGPVTDHVPVMQRPSADGEPGPVVTQWDMERVEQCGQLKIDFLGLRNMTVLDRCLAYIKERHGKDIDLYRDVPWDNRLTYKRLSEGDSIGTFQMESSGMKEMMMSLRPDSITDIMALIALYRPGPMGSGMDKLFIARKHGRKIGMREPHPVLNEMLPTTYGIMLYQEDVLKVAGEIAGFTPLERETLRKALGKKLVDKLAKMKKEFIAGAKQKGVVGPQEAAQIFEDIEYFGGYGFSASHAASYSLISYWTAYFKFNYTVEYMAALLTSVKNSKDKSTLYLNECRRLGIRVLPPSITESESEFRVISDDTILFGLGSINGIGHNIVEKLTGRDRKHIKTINQFLMSADKDIMKKDVMNHLVNSGAMDELIPEQQDRLLTTEDKHEVLKLEQESLGLYVIEHPLDGVWDHIKTKATHTIQQAINLGKSRQNVTVAGVITQSVRKVTKTGNVMYLLQVEDLESNIEVVVFGNHAKDYDFPVGTIGIISGTVDQDVFGETVTSKIMLNDFTQPDLPKYATGKAFVYRLDQMPHYESLETIASVASQFPGDCIIVFEFFDGDDKLVRLKLNQPVSESIEEKLGQLVKSVMSYV